MLCIVQNMLQMGAAALEANLQTSPKLSLIPTHFSFRLSQIFAVFNAFSSSMFKLMALNTAKNLRNLEREISLGE